MYKAENMGVGLSLGLLTHQVLLRMYQITLEKYINNTDAIEDRRNKNSPTLHLLLVYFLWYKYLSKPGTDLGKKKKRCVHLKDSKEYC